MRPSPPDALQAAILMAEFVQLHAVLKVRREEGATEIVLRRLEAMRQEAAEAFWEWRDALIESAGEDPAVWGPIYDHVRSLASEIRGRGPWVSGKDGAPHGAVLH